MTFSMKGLDKRTCQQSRQNGRDCVIHT